MLLKFTLYGWTIITWNVVSTKVEVDYSISIVKLLNFVETFILNILDKLFYQVLRFMVSDALSGNKLLVSRKDY